MTFAQLVDDIADSSGFVALLLALVTVFTAEVARQREQHRRLESPSGTGFKRIGGLAIGLAVLTGASALALLGWFIDAVDAVLDPDTYEPPLAIFAISWMLLVVLVLWQVSIAQGALRRR